MTKYVSLNDYWDASLEQYKEILGNRDNEVFEEYELNRFKTLVMYRMRYEEIAKIRYRSLLTSIYLSQGRFDTLTECFVKSNIFRNYYQYRDLSEFKSNLEFQTSAFK